MITDHIELGVHFQIMKVQYYPIFSLPTEYNPSNSMNDNAFELRITHQDISNIFASLLKIPRTHRTLHPSQERSKYSDILDWLTKAVAELLKVKDLTPRQLCEKEQQIIVSCFQELIQLSRKECVEKSLLLQMILQYLVGTLNAYWNALENANRQIRYQFQHNSVRVEREYITQLKRLQCENEQLRRDKQHRWRNMFMLIKDNRIHRRQNKKLHVCINYEMEKNVSLAEQMLLLREENEKLKFKLAYLEDDPVRIEGFVETQLRLMELEKSVRSYPKRSKKILKNDMLKIEIQQINNLDDKIKFIIKAIQETGEIIDEFYDEETIWSNFQYNISTQTDSSTDDKATNTPSTRTANAQTSLPPSDLTRFDIQQNYNIIIRGQKKERKETKEKESKQSMMMSATLGFGSRFGSRREEALREFPFKRMVDNQFSICESVKMTIYNGRISYISTYNTEIFNGIELAKRIQEKIQTEKKDHLAEKKAEGIDMEVQTQAPEEAVSKPQTRSQPRATTKYSPNLMFAQSTQQCRRKKTIMLPQMNIFSEVSYEYNPMKRSQHHKFKVNLSQPIHDKEPTHIQRNNSSQKGLQSSRSIRTHKRLNTLEKSYNPAHEQVLFKKMEEERKNLVRSDFQTQTQEKTKNKIDQLVSTTNLDLKQERISLTKQANPTNNTSNSSSFLGSTDIKKIRSEIMKKPFNQSDNIAITIAKSKAQRSSDISPLKTIQQKKLSKFSKNELIKHSRVSTESNENDIVSQTIYKMPRQFKMKPLHRISEVLTEADFAKEQPIPKEKTALPLMVTKEGEVRSMDFSKGVEKILKSMDIRRNQILTNNYTLKTYLSSYFKCLYGKEIYYNFIQFLAKSEPQEAILCFSRLANAKCPEPYLIDIFKAFVKTIGKCYLLGQSPCSSRLRQQVLKFLSGLFLEQQQTIIFASKMRNKGCYSLMGWFNSLQLQLRLNALQSQLYCFLSNWLNESIDSISYDCIEELSYFMHADQDNYKFIIKAKYFLSDSTPIHRFCLFSYRYQWHRMLNLESSIEAEYHKRLGKFIYEDSIRRIEQNRTILLEFKFLDKCYRYWNFMSEKYADRIHYPLLMLIQLNLIQYRMKNELPLSRDLKYLSLVFQGLQKKKEFQSLKTKLQTLQNKQCFLDSKIL